MLRDGPSAQTRLKERVNQERKRHNPRGSLFPKQASLLRLVSAQLCE